MAAPRIGIGVFVFKRDGTFILGKRKGSLGSGKVLSTACPYVYPYQETRSDGENTGTFALPVGHLEYGETFAQCAARELFEETDIKVPEASIHYLTTVNSVFEKERLHYVTVAVGCLIGDDVEPKVSLSTPP